MTKEDLNNFQKIIRQNNKPKTITPQQETKIRELRQKGLSYREIKSETGFTLHHIYTTLKEG